MFINIIVLCLTASTIQIISGHFVRNNANIENIVNLAADAELANGLANVKPLAKGLTPGVAGVTNGGRFTVTSSSATPTAGVTVTSENLVVEGPLAVTGQLPFVGAVAMDGALPAEGSGAVQYDCGNGNVGIVSENVEVTNKPTYNGLGYNGVTKGLGYRTVY